MPHASRSESPTLTQPSNRRALVVGVAVLGVALVVAGLSAWKRLANTRVEFYANEDLEFSLAEQLVIPWRASGYVAEIREYLPQLPRPIQLRVQAAALEQVSEGGDEAYDALPDVVIWAVDVKRQGGALRLARTELRGRLFHELYHLARDAHVADGGSMSERMVEEGLATAFERDYGQISKPRGWYPADVQHWVDELLSLPSPPDLKPWMQRHPDGREWVAFKAGTFVVDQAYKASGKTSVDLVVTPANEILSLAKITH